MRYKLLKSLLAACCVALCTTPAHALLFTFTKIAEAGDVPVGSPGGLDGSYNDPAVDDYGNVAFEGNTINALATTVDDTVVMYTNGTLRQIHRDNDLVPGTTVTNYTLDDHIEVRNGIAAFAGRAAPALEMKFIATSDGVDSRIVAMEGLTTLPSTNSPVITSINSSEGFGFDGTRVAFRASYAGGSGIYLEDGLGGLTRIADTTEFAPGGEAFTGFDNAMPDANGPGIVFSSRTAGGWGIMLSENGIITNVADYADYPPVSNIVDDVLHGEPDIDNGQVVFNTTQYDFDEPYNSPEQFVAASVQFYDGNTVTSIVDQSTPLPTGGTAFYFENAAIANGAVAFVAFADTNNIYSRSAVLLWREGVLHKVVALGDVVDGGTVTKIGSFNRPFLADGFLALELTFAGDTRGKIYRIAFEEEPTAPVLRWNLEEGGGIHTLEVVSGVTNVATLINGPTWTNGLAPGSSASVSFQNTTPDSYIDAGTLDVNGLYGPDVTEVNGQVLPNQWTISAWVSIPDQFFVSADRCIATSDTDGGQNWWLFFVRNWNGNSNNLGFDFRSTRVDSSLNVPAGKPVFVSVSGDASGTLFENGGRSRFAIWDGSTWSFDETSRYINLRLDGLEIGSFLNGTREFIGDIDEVHIYGKALSRTELAALALSGEIGGPLAGQVLVPTNAVTMTSVTFQVQFTEPVMGFDAGDLVLTDSGGLSSGTPVISGTGSVFTVDVPIVGEGTLNIDLLPGFGVQTRTGDPLVSHYANMITVDFTPPRVTGIFMGSQTGDVAYLTIHFSEAVQGSGQLILEDIDSSFSNAQGGGLFSLVNTTNYQTEVLVTVPDGETGGVLRVSVDPGSPITDLAGLSLSTPNPAVDLFIAASPYQLWAIDKGLVAGSNFTYNIDADGDFRLNGYEYIRDGDPLTPFDPLKRAVYIANVDGTNYLALTVAAPDGAIYQIEGDFIYAEFCNSLSLCMYDVFYASDDIRNIVGGNLGIMEDPGITPPPGLPALSPGFSYRHFRMTDPVETLPTGFIMNDLFEGD